MGTSSNLVIQPFSTSNRISTYLFRTEIKDLGHSGPKIYNFVTFESFTPYLKGLPEDDYYRLVNFLNLIKYNNAIEVPSTSRRTS